jgi:hypothetical protein
MSAVWDSGLYDGGTLLVLLALSDWAHDDGSRVFPTVDQVAAKARMTVRNVQYALRRLKGDGMLCVVENGIGGRGKPTEYRIDVERVKNLRREKGANGSEERVKTEARKGAKSDIPPTPPLEDNHHKPSLNPPRPAPDGAGLFGDNPETGKPKKKTNGHARMALPAWLPEPDWQAFEEMRKKIRKPMTDHAADLVIRELEKLRTRGFDPVAVLSNSIRNCWQDVYEPKTSTLANGSTAPPPAETAQRARLEKIAEIERQNEERQKRGVQI